MLNQHHFPKSAFPHNQWNAGWTALLGDELAHKVVSDNPNQLAATFEPIEVVKGDLYTPFIDKSEEKVAEWLVPSLWNLRKSTTRYCRPTDWAGIIPPFWGMDLPWFISLRKCWYSVQMSAWLSGWVPRGSVGSSFVATMIGITEGESFVSSLCLWPNASIPSLNWFTVLPWFQGLWYADKKTVHIQDISWVKWTGYSFWNLPWLRWWQGAWYWRTFLGRSNRVLIWMSEIFLVRNMPFVLVRLVQAFL